jgi:hypothetical protein
LLAGILILMLLAWPAAKRGVRDATVFGGTALISFLPLTIWNRLNTVAGSALPDWVVSESSVFVVRQSSEFLVFWPLREWILALPTIGRMLVGSPILEAALVRVPIPGLRELAGLMCFAASAALPFLVLRNIGSTNRGFRDHLAIAVSLLPISLVVFLTAVQFKTGATWPISNGRYYVPLLPVGVLLSMFLLSRVGHRLLTGVAVLLLVGFLAYFAAIKPIQAVANASERNELAAIVLGFKPQEAAHASPSGKPPLPSNLLFTNREHSREKIKQLYEEHPDALFLVPRHYAHYVYDSFSGGPTPGVNLRSVPPLTADFWRRAYTSRSVRVFWVVGADSGLEPLEVPQKTRVFRDTVEHTSIWQSELEAGQSFLAPRSQI